MKKFISKIVYNPRTLVFFLSLVMIVTTSVSFVYWKSTLSGNDKDKTLNIHIGSGEAVETIVDLSEVSIDKTLVPKGRVPAGSTEVTDKIEFTVNVTWIIDDSAPTASDVDGFVANKGTLTVNLESVYLVNGIDDDENITDYLGLSGKLIVVSIDDGGVFDIYGYDETKNPNAAVPVKITITMNEPANRDDYNMIADKTIKLKFNFKIESTYDLE